MTISRRMTNKDRLINNLESLHYLWICDHQMASKKGQSPILQFRNCHILRSHHIIKDDFWVCNGKILNPEKVFFDTKVTADIQIDCDNSIICPGFIDVQINGNYSMFCLLSILYYLIPPTTTNACVFKETVCDCRCLWSGFLST